MKNGRYLRFFRGPLGVSLLLFFIVVGISARSVFWSGKVERKAYRDLMEVIEDQKAGREKPSQPIKQIRTNIRRDLHTTKNGRRLQSQIESEKSEFLLTLNEGKATVSERLMNVSCTAGADGQGISLLEGIAGSMEFSPSEEGKNYQVRLTEDVKIDHALGTIFANELDLSFEKNGRNLFGQIGEVAARGQIAIVYHDKAGRTNQLQCHGNATISHVRLKAVVESDGSGRQVEFCDPFGNFYADKATVDYVLEEGKVVPVAIILEGNVMIENRHLSASETSPQYALSDEAIYNHQDCLLKLISRSGNRVLLYDKINHLQISAPELHIQRDANTGKESIKGIGDVRFSLMNQEIQQLKKRILME